MGYCTEKILDAFAAATVPIYWGDPKVARIYNPEAFIDCTACTSVQDMVEKVRAVEEDRERWLHMLRQPAFTDPERVRQEIEGNMGAATVGMQARLMSQAMRKLSAVISKSQTVVIFINQLREKVGVLYGNPETTPGGRALKFYSSVRIDVRRTEQLKRGGEVYGNHVRCKIVKNKVAPPFRVAEFDILYGQGISRMSEILDFAVKYDIVKKSGSWFSYNGERLGQGKEAVQKLIEENPSMLTELEEKVRAAMQENDGQDVQTFELDEDGDGDGDGDGDAGLLDDEFDIRTVKDDGADE